MEVFGRLSSMLWCHRFKFHWKWDFSKPRQHFITQNPSYSPFHFPDMTEILLKKTDQSARMCRLIWVFIGRPNHFVTFYFQPSVHAPECSTTAGMAGDWPSPPISEIHTTSPLTSLQECQGQTRKVISVNSVKYIREYRKAHQWILKILWASLQLSAVFISSPEPKAHKVSL